MSITPGKAIRSFCLSCIGASDASGAFDCLAVDGCGCGIYPAHPFRGKPMPRSKQPIVDGKIPEGVLAEEARLKEIASQIPKSKPCASMIRTYCRDFCQPGDRIDCKEQDCSFYPWHPFRACRTGKRVLSEKQLAALRSNLSKIGRRGSRMSQKPKQKSSSCQGWTRKGVEVGR